MINARDLADELLTLQPVDPARCNPRRKAHPVIGGRELECSECWRERVTGRLEQWRRDIVSSRPGPLKPHPLDSTHHIPAPPPPVAPSPATPERPAITYELCKPGQSDQPTREGDPT